VRREPRLVRLLTFRGASSIRACTRVSPTATSAPSVAWHCSFLNRKCLTMAAVFPKNDAVDKLAGAAAAFKQWEEIFSEERLKAIGDAVQDI
jgi:hypothetical protein